MKIHFKLVNKIKLFIFINMSILSLYSQLTYADTKETDNISSKLVDEFVCPNKKITISDYKTLNAPDGIENYKIGQFKNKWVAYDQAMFYGEQHSYTIINKDSCEQYTIDGKNILFLGDEIFLTWSWDFEAEYYPNQISTYLIKDSVVHKTGEFIPKTGGPSKAMWVNKNTIKFVLVDFNKNYSEGEDTYTYQEKVIVRKNDNWVYQ